MLAEIAHHGTLTYAGLDEKVRRFASGLRDLGIGREVRVLMAMQDTGDYIEFGTELPKTAHGKIQRFRLR